MTFKHTLMAASIMGAFALSGPVMALTKAEIKTESDDIARHFKSAKAACDSLRANAKSICMAQATGAYDVSRAEFAVRQNDTAHARNNVRVVKADADYGVARQKCGDHSGNVKDVCIKDAKALQVNALADAKADLKIGDAYKSADDKAAVMRKDAADDKRDANYAASRERCDKYAGDVMNRCIADAKLQFGMK